MRKVSNPMTGNTTELPYKNPELPAEERIADLLGRMTLEEKVGQMMQLDARSGDLDDLIVIAAGYTELMGRFLHANPGLESRFNKYFYFEDYNGAQLLAIFQSMCAKNGYTLDDKATEYAKSYFKTLYEERDENFGNARDVRNVFERAVARQSDRVAALEKPGKEELMALTVADLQEEGGPVPDGAPDETLPESP